MQSPKRRDYIARRMAIADLFGTSDIESEITRLYRDETLSAVEISERLSVAGITISPRSIQRIVNKHGAIRSLGDSFRLAVKRGRVHFAYKDERFKTRRKNLNAGLRFSILQRDGLKCVLCGNTAENSILEVDHIVALVNGGNDEPSNLRTLCHNCNMGKRIEERER